MSLLNKLRSTIERKEVTTVASFATTSGPEWEKYMRVHANTFARGYGLGGVSLERGFQLTAFLTCVKIIAEDTASLPLFINRTRGESVSVDRSHPLHHLLHDSPNPDMTALSFREAVTSYALTSGKGYASVEYSRFDDARPVAMWPMDPTNIRRDAERSGRPVFVDTRPGGKTYTRREMFELTGFGINGIEGLDMLRYMREAIGLGVSQQEFAGRFFSQSQLPPLVLEHPGTTNVEGVKEAFRKAHQGAENWHTPAVLQEGMKATLLQWDATKTQLQEQRAFQLIEICRPFRMPPHKLGELGRATWGNVSAMNTQYLNECLRPWLVRWEQGINTFLLRDEHPERYAEHEIGGMLRGDFTQQTEGFRTLLASGVYSINEVRGLLNYNSIPGGDEHFIQLNQGTVQNVAQGMTSGAIRVGGDQPAA